MNIHRGFRDPLTDLLTDNRPALLVSLVDSSADSDATAHSSRAMISTIAAVVRTVADAAIDLGRLA